jgi:hypothetical protein
VFGINFGPFFHKLIWSPCRSAGFDDFCVKSSELLLHTKLLRGKYLRMHACMHVHTALKNELGKVLFETNAFPIYKCTNDKVTCLIVTFGYKISCLCFCANRGDKFFWPKNSFSFLFDLYVHTKDEHFLLHSNEICKNFTDFINSFGK